MPPSGSAYRVTYRKLYSSAMDPKYAITVSIPPYVHAGVVLDWLSTSPKATRPSVVLTIRIVQRDIPDSPFHIPSVHLCAFRAALSHASRRTPYCDLIEYPMVSLLNDDHLSILVYFTTSFCRVIKWRPSILGTSPSCPRKAHMGW